MADNSFTITFKTIADATGLTQIATGLQNVQRQVQQVASVLNTGLQFTGVTLGVRELNQLGQKAQEVSENMAAWTLQMLRGKDGSQELVKEFQAFNEELAKTTGTLPSTSRAIEQLFSRAGLTGDQIKSATKGVIEFAASSAGTIEPLTLASLLARRFAGAADQTDISLVRLGIHAKDLTGIIAEMLKRGGNSAEIMAQASGGMKQFEVASEHARVALGDVVNLVRIPFLTSLTASLADAGKNLDDLSKSFSTFGQNVWVTSGLVANWIAGFIGRFKDMALTIEIVAKAIFSNITTFIQNTVEKVKAGAELAVDAAIIALNKLAKFAAEAANTLSFGAINIDTTKFDQNIADMQQRSKDLVTQTTANITANNQALANQLTSIRNQADEIMKEIIDREAKGLSVDQLQKQYAAFVNQLKTLTASPGSAVVPAGQNDQGKAATDALTVAKYKLTQAEEGYRTELERVKLLEDTGVISGQRADQLRITAGQQYLGVLRQIDAEMPKLIKQQQDAGNVKGVQELTLEWQRVRLAELKTLDAIANSTFWGKIGSQIRQLANQWADLGKQIGGFLTQQFQNFASTAGNAIAGLVTRTANWKEAIGQLVQSFISGLATMLIQWVLARTVMAALNRVFGQADTEASTLQAGAASKAWAPAAISASIASYGVAAATGLTAYIGALGTGTAAATAGSAAGGIGGYESGGLTPDRPTLAMVSERGPEFIFSAPATAALGPQNLARLHQLALAGIARPSSSGASSRSPSRSNSMAGAESVEHHHFLFVDDFHAAVRAYHNSAAGRKDFHRLKIRNRLR